MILENIDLECKCNREKLLFEANPYRASRDFYCDCYGSRGHYINVSVAKLHNILMLFCKLDKFITFICG